MNLEFKKIRIHTLTPLFIGDGTEYSRLDFWFDTENQELVLFKEKDFIESLTEEQKNNLGDCSIKEISKIIENNKSKLNGIRKKVCFDILRKYEREKNNNNFENRFIIKKFIADTLTQKPYIPGSSLKGALRTGYISKLSKDKRTIDEEKCLGKMDKDIFSSVKISDLMPEEKTETFILWADRASKKINKRKEGYEHLSVTMFEAVKPGSSFAGDVTFLPKENKFKSLDDLLQSSQEYAFSLLKDENIALKQPKLEEIKSVMQSFGSNKKIYLVRLGGLIGAESHTIDGFRSIRIKLRQGYENRKYTTRTIYASADREANIESDKYTSCGWCLIEVMDNPSAQIPQEFKNYTKKIANSVMPLYTPDVIKKKLENLSQERQQNNNRYYKTKKPRNNDNKRYNWGDPHPKLGDLFKK